MEYLTDPTFTRVDKLVPYLHRNLEGTVGVPKDDKRRMNPNRHYCDMAAGTAKGWCTQHDQVRVFRANRAGVPTRFVFGTRTPENSIACTGHAWAGSYIREQHRWAFVDLSQVELYITDKESKVLNTAELFQLNQHNAFDSTLVRV